MVLHPWTATNISQNEDLHRDLGLVARTRTILLGRLRAILRREKQDDDCQQAGQPECNPDVSLDHLVTVPSVLSVNFEVSALYGHRFQVIGAWYKSRTNTI